MKRTALHTIILLQFGVTLPLMGQESTVYATVISTKLFIVGAANPQTGLFYQRPSEDTVWHRTGAKNIRANCVAAFPPAKGRVVYVASGNGLHKTTDGGQSWKITTGWEITEALWVSVDPHNESNVYIGTAYGVFKTTDGCTTWRQTHSGFTSSVIVDHSNSSVLYASTEDGVFKSLNAGETWSRLGISVKRIRIVVQNPMNPVILFVGTEDNGMYTTLNGGKTWDKVEAGIDHNTFYTITFDPNNPDAMYAGGYITGVYKSIDGGKRWTRTCKGFSVESIHAIAVDPVNGNRVYAATIGDGVYRSDDGGISWRSVGLRSSQVWSISIQPY
jgi:photosystem II stability/assembly factor-like uncharacterized protein